jgi:tRNA pseudouridine38/39 synthase
MIRGRFLSSATICRPVMASSTYHGWSREDLISRLHELEAQSKRTTTSPKPQSNSFNFSTHHRRKIAVKFCYSGWEYNGLAFQNSKTSLPTVEAVVFDAFVKARLIDPGAGFDGCGWERCGRTDRGVSAAGQVISLWVRSALGPSTGDQTNPTTEVNYPDSTTPMLEECPEQREEMSSDRATDATTPGLEFDFDEDDLQSPSLPAKSTSPEKGTNSEHDYLSILNRILPPTIRVLAWSPISDTFSARFSCMYRHYKYFFSTTAPGQNLDLDRMRAAASRLIGGHDFRNLCKLDPGKQITVFKRKIMRADIEPLNDYPDGMYVFNLVGTAFLYHQVRHIMAVLFLVGSGLEDPSVVTALMNVEDGVETQHGDEPLPIVDRKPEYQMADALPLLLWECGYPEGELSWRTTPSEDRCISRGNGIGNESGTELYQQLDGIYARSQVYTTLNNHFFSAASVHHLPPPKRNTNQQIVQPDSDVPPKLLIPLGGGAYKRIGQEKYVPLLRRNRLDTVEAANERWRLGKGLRRNERRKAAEAAVEDDGNE